MVFHEITRSAIEEAVANPRSIDYGLVDAAETRRVLDRLYGYEVSPVLWRRVNRGLSAGRVQSPLTRLVVERERERMAFVAAGYWGVDATFDTSPSFSAALVALDHQRVATGRDFGADGRLSGSGTVVVVDEATARSLVDGLQTATFAVRSVEEKDYRSGPKPPFMTSTLQQEGGRKLRLSAQQVMRLAQGLYERGYITYMRTDSTALSDHRPQRGALAGVVAVRSGVPVARPPQVGRQGQERAGGPRGHPPRRRLLPHAGGRAARAEPVGAPPLRTDLDAHAGVADGRCAWQDRQRAPRRHDH